MKINKLLALSSHFLKLARLKIDASTAETMKKAIDHCIGTRHLKDIKQKSIIVDPNEEPALIAKCQQLLNPSYQRYSSKISNGNSFYWSSNTVSGWNCIHLITFFNQQGKEEKNLHESMEGSSIGAFKPNSAGGIVIMDLSDDVRSHFATAADLETYIFHIHSMLEHELRHKSQVDYKDKENLAEWGGLPGKRDRLPDRKVDWEGYHSGYGGVVPHPLRAVEFYPNLMNAVDNFCKDYGDASPEELKELIKIRVCANLDVEYIDYSIEEYAGAVKEFEQKIGDYTISPSILFYSWKKYGGNRMWRKGVTEFVKAVQEKLSR